jgi:septum formation protein
LGLKFIILPSDIDESVLESESPEDYVLRLAQAKALKCLQDIAAQQLTPLPVLAADTTVTIDGLILGKPSTDEEAFAMLTRISGCWHEVHTGIAVGSAAGISVDLSTTRVQMEELSEATIGAYIATGEPKDKAGAYGIQGLASVFIKHIEGSYTGVMGLPVYESTQLLAKVGVWVL